MREPSLHLTTLLGEGQLWAGRKVKEPVIACSMVPLRAGQVRGWSVCVGKKGYAKDVGCSGKAMCYLRVQGKPRATSGVRATHQGLSDQHQVPKCSMSLSLKPDHPGNQCLFPSHQVQDL